MRHRVVPALLILLSLALVVWLLHLSRYGFDLTDEGHYLNSISRPFLYDVNLPPTLFGHVLLPVYEVLGKDVVLLRQVGVLITFGLAFALALAVLRIVWGTARSDRLAATALAAGVACLSLVYYSYLVITPSYNLVAFQALMIVSLGAVLVHGGVGLPAWLMTGFGGWLLFMGKPSSAVAIAVLLPVCLLGIGAFRWRGAVLAAVTAGGLLVGSAMLIDGSPGATIERFAKSLELSEVVAAGHEFASIFRLDHLYLTRWDWSLILYWSVAIFALTATGMAQGRVLPSLWLAACAGIASAVLTYLFMSYRIEHWARNVHLFPISVAMILPVLVHLIARPPRHWTNARAPVMICLFLITLPHAHIFGSNNHYWNTGASVGFFWVLAAVAALGAVYQSGHPIAVARFVPAAFVFPALTVVLMDSGIKNPYRQPPDLTSFSAPFDLADGGTVIVEARFAAYLSTATDVASTAGLSPGMPVIDLTGQSPGLLFALGMNNVGLPWIAGAYPGSDALAAEIYSLTPCEIIGSAWVLDEPEGARRISPATLGRFGADLGRDFTQAGTFLVPEYSGDRGTGDRPRQFLYKPTRTLQAARQACEDSKTGG
ncbi:MAG: hypothetical protein ACE369_18090 [Roseovarius sp.]